MYEFGPEHNLSYRQEVTHPIFNNIRMVESCAVVGAGSMGKTRLLDFIMRLDVQTFFFGDEASKTLIIRVDCNRMQEDSEWGFYEILITSIIDCCQNNPNANTFLHDLNELRKPAILNHNAILAFRHSELMIRTLKNDGDFKLVFMIDEFEHIYKTFPVQLLSNLRSIRDQNKYRLSYVLFLRNFPETLRPIDESENLYEQFSRSIIGLGPYGYNDSYQLLTQLEIRRRLTIDANTKEQIIKQSGGHPGLIQVLLDEYQKNPSLKNESETIISLKKSKAVAGECMKLAASLPEDEVEGLNRIAKKQSIDSTILYRLEIKGIVKDGRIFSPVFESFILGE